MNKFFMALSNIMEIGFKMSYRPNYFLFSLQYLVLTMVTYAALVIAPLMLFAERWLLAAIAFALLLVSYRLIYVILFRYFTAARRSEKFVTAMTLLTVFPPFIGPAVVMVYSLGRST